MEADATGFREAVNFTLETALVGSVNFGDFFTELDKNPGRLSLAVVSFPFAADMFLMEQRREHRVPTDQPVSLTVLGDSETRLTATVKNATGRGLGLISPQSVADGAAVKIEIGDSIFLGEAMYCNATEDGYYLGIELTEVLSGLAALSRIAQAFNDQLEPAASQLEPAASRLEPAASRLRQR
jgi:hypothetical protein